MEPILFPHLSWLQAFWLGLIQGITEFLPVSSTAHMKIIPALLHHSNAAWPVDVGSAYSAIAQLGPVIAIVWYFRGDLVRYVAGIQRSLKAKTLFPEGDVDARLGWFALLGTIPGALAGVLLEKKVDTEYRHMTVIAVVMIVLAFILLVAESRSRRNKPLEQVTFRDAMTIGAAQVLALIPGASRSGCTITAGLFLGLEREAAARFSFLLSIPFIVLAGVYKLIKTFKQPVPWNQVAGPYVFSAVVAGVTAYLVVRWLLRYLSDEKHTTMPFIIYRILLGLSLLALVSLKFLAP